MQTRFTAAQLADPDTADAEAILRTCVHCGFCQATCPTYVLLGDELDSPRGRIYLIKNMLETGTAPSAKVVGHIDRCLSCLSCMTTCPSGVHYMHLVDLARRRIEAVFRRPAAERMLRRALTAILPSPRRFRAALRLAGLFGPLARRMPGALGRMARLAPRGAPGVPASAAGAVHRAVGGPRHRGGAARRVRPAGDGRRNQRRDRRAADPQRLRGRAGPRRRLLRGDRPPSRRPRPGARRRAGQPRRLAGGNRRCRALCRDRQRIGLRRHAQGLPPPVPGLPRTGAPMPRWCPILPATSASS